MAEKNIDYECKTMKLGISDYIPIICGYLAWSGGDSAIFDFTEISRQLNLESDVVRTSLDYMLDKGFLAKEGSKHKLTTGLAGL